MKIASYNIEWMNTLFDNGKIDNNNNEWSSRFGVTKQDQLNAIAKVIRIVDADAFLILEAPNEYEAGATIAALEGFAQHFGLRQTRAVIGTASGTDQEIAFLYDPEKMNAKFRPHKGPNPPKFSDEFKLKIDSDHAETYKFSKPPLELDVHDKITKQNFKIIGAHFKTKAPHGARNDEQAKRYGLKNRRKQIAQATWLRAQVETIKEPLIVAGDFNDGPGQDDLERIIGQSSIDILTHGGALFDPTIENPNGYTTARFFNREDKKFKEALIDFVFVNPKMRPMIEKWEIWHPLNHAKISAIPEWQDAFLTASDHYPVSIQISE